MGAAYLRDRVSSFDERQDALLLDRGRTLETVTVDPAEHFLLEV